MNTADFRVWIVEDNRLHADLVKAALGNEVSVEVFDNGAALIEHVATGVALCDVLLLDWRLPDMNGLEVCRFLRTSHSQIALPIVMVTVQGNKTDVVEGLSAGANDYVTKPFDASELLARVRTQWQAKRADTMRRQAEHERDHYRDLMLGMLGHDLRTPLAAINTGTQALMLQEDRSDAQTRVLARIQSSVNRMARMIDQILDFTRSRFGGIPVARAAVSLRELVETCVTEFELGFPGACVQMNVNNPGRVHWDEDRLAQALNNLLVNAATHGERGQPIGLFVDGDDDTVRISVTNRGTPISPELQAKLFDPFRRGEMRRSTPGQQGLGLGLFIAKQIVEAHGGGIRVTSDAENGTRFTLTLPRSLEVAAEPAMRAN